jgi:CheY-like chemotaxis protein
MDTRTGDYPSQTNPQEDDNESPTQILLVEDDRNDVMLFQMAFQKTARNSTLHVVHDGEEAIHYLEGKGRFNDRQRYPLPHLILLDLKMPKIGGFEFLEYLRQRSRGDLRLIPVIIMSSSVLTEDINRAYALGASSYLVKPINWNEFIRALAALHIYWTEIVEKPTICAP